MAGKKGRSGRKSAYEEKAGAELLRDLFFKPHDPKELQAKVDSGNFSGFDLFAREFYAGNETYMLRVFDRIFPDTMQHDLTEPAAAMLAAASRARLAKYRPKLQAHAGKPATPAPKGGAKA